MYYCFLTEDINGLENDPLIIQLKYAARLDSLCIGSLKRQTVRSQSDEPISLVGEKVLLRCTSDNLLPGLELLSKQGADSIETKEDIINIENWYKLKITRRTIYETSLTDLLNHIPTELRENEKIFVKSKSKDFSAIINPTRIIQHDSNTISFLQSKNTSLEKGFLLSKYVDLKRDSFGTRESRHVVINNQLANSSRTLHTLKHTVPKSHKNKAQEIVDQIKVRGSFPSNYVLDLGEFVDDGGTYLDIIEFNPLSCSLCFVNNSVFMNSVPEVEELYRQLQMGREYCYDAISSPQNYEIERVSNKNYSYSLEERYCFL